MMTPRITNGSRKCSEKKRFERGVVRSETAKQPFLQRRADQRDGREQAGDDLGAPEAPSAPRAARSAMNAVAIISRKITTPSSQIISRGAL